MNTTLDAIEEVTGRLTTRHLLRVKSMSRRRLIRLLLEVNENIRSSGEQRLVHRPRSNQPNLYIPTSLGTLDDVSLLKTPGHEDRPWAIPPERAGNIVLPSRAFAKGPAVLPGHILGLLLYAKQLSVDEPLSSILAQDWASAEDIASANLDALLDSLEWLTEVRPLISAGRLVLIPQKYRGDVTGYRMETLNGVMKRMAGVDPELAEILDAGYLPFQEMAWASAAISYVVHQLIEEVRSDAALDLYLPMTTHEFALESILATGGTLSDYVISAPRGRDYSRLRLRQGIAGRAKSGATLARLDAPALREGTRADKLLDLILSEDFVGCRAAIGRALARIEAQLDSMPAGYHERASEILQEEVSAAVNELSHRAAEKGSARAGLRKGAEAMFFGALPAVVGAATGSPPQSPLEVGATIGTTGASRFIWTMRSARRAAGRARTAKVIGRAVHRPRAD